MFGSGGEYLRFYSPNIMRRCRSREAESFLESCNLAVDFFTSACDFFVNILHLVFFAPHTNTHHTHSLTHTRTHTHAHTGTSAGGIHFLFADLYWFFSDLFSLPCFFSGSFGYLFIRARQRKKNQRKKHLLSSGAPRRNYLATPARRAEGWCGGVCVGFVALRCCLSQFLKLIPLRFIHGHTRQRAFALAIQRLAIYSAFFQLSAFMFSFPFASRLQFFSGSVRWLWFRFAAVLAGSTWLHGTSSHHEPVVDFK